MNIYLLAADILFFIINVIVIGAVFIFVHTIKNGNEVKAPKPFVYRILLADVILTVLLIIINTAYFIAVKLI